MAVIALTNALCMLLWMLPARAWSNRWLLTLDYGLLTFVTFVCIGVGVADAEFVNFIGKRSSYDLLFIRDDVGRHSASILLTYWPLVLSVLALTAITMWLMPRFNFQAPKESWIKGTLWRVAMVFLVFTAARGGFGFKPINPMQAYFSTKHELGVLTLNTPINLIKTRPNGKVERTRYFAEDREAILRLKKMTDLSRPPLAVAKNWNVVVILLESFATEFTGAGNKYQGYTPFFDSLAKKAIYFRDNFANARRSIEGLPAVMCGLPAIMEAPIITSDFSSNRLDCLPKILGKHGYSTYFLHGAHNGSMHFDSFSNLAGFENFTGLNEYPKDNPEDFDKYWGVLDEPMLQYAVKTIDQAPKPVMLGLFSLSSHHPYYIPPKYAGKFPKGDLEIHESIGYTDHSLQKFFEAAEKRPWFKNTIFVVTADHTQKSSHKEYVDLLGYYRVPLLIYIPGLEPDKAPVSRDRITQHIDIMPSVLDLLGIEVADRLLVGQSVFDEGKTGRAYNYYSGGYWYIEPGLAVDFGRPPRPLSVFTFEDSFVRNEADPKDPRFHDAIENIKAVVHYMNEGLTGNSLYRWRASL